MDSETEHGFKNVILGNGETGLAHAENQATGFLTSMLVSH